MPPPLNLTGLRNQDRIAQAQFFELFKKRMLSICIRYLRDIQRAEEATMDGFVLAFNNIDRLSATTEAGIYSWLRTIMFRECLRKLNGSNKVEVMFVAELADILIMDEAIDDCEMEDILEAIASLPDGYREAFNLFHIEGFSHREIAGMLNITESTSASQCSKARRSLQKQLLSKGNNYAKRV